MEWARFFNQNLKEVTAYQPGLREEQIRQIAQSENIYKLSSNESPLPPFPSAIQAMQQGLVTLNEYPDGACHSLVQQLSVHYGIPTNQIMVGNGSNELVDLIAASCLAPGDSAVYCWPSFVVYRSSTQIAGAECRELPLAPNGAFDLDAVLAAIDDTTKLVYVCTPNNPTGAVLERTDFEAFLAKLPAQVLLVVDAAYEEFVDSPTAARPLDYFDGIKPYVVLRTFSKAYALAGIRCGYGFAPAPVVEVLSKIREPFNVNTLSQLAAEASLADTSELKKRVALNALCREQLVEGLGRLGLKTLPSHANFVWVEIPAPGPAATFDALLKKGIIVRFLPGAEALRVGVGDSSATQATLRAFAELFGDR